jgi:hypothetical protein
MAEVEVDEVLGLVSYKASEISSYDAVPGRPLPLVELRGSLAAIRACRVKRYDSYSFLDMLGNVLCGVSVTRSANEGPFAYGVPTHLFNTEFVHRILGY